MVREQPFWLGGRAERSGRVLDVTNPFDGATVARTWLAGPAEFDRATEAAIAAAPAMRALAAYERVAILALAIREGPRYTIEEMTELQLLVINRRLP